MRKPRKPPKRFPYRKGARTVYHLTDAGLERLRPIFEDARKRGAAVAEERLAAPHTYEIVKWKQTGGYGEVKWECTVTQHQASVRVEVS